jgi:hypothetical protein
MSAVNFPKFSLAAALAIGLTLACAFSQHDAAAQTVRDHRARLCRVGYDALPHFQGNPLTIATCHLPANNVQVIGSFCTCSVLIEGHYTTVGGSIVHA